MSTPSKDRELREKLAAIEHERWADWQKYMHSLCSKLGDFDTDYALVIPSNSVTHWERQIATPYKELTEHEKSSDMEQVDRYWPLIEAYIDSLKQSLVAEMPEGNTMTQPDISDIPDNTHWIYFRGQKEALRLANQAIIKVFNGRM